MSATLTVDLTSKDKAPLLPLIVANLANDHSTSEPVVSIAGGEANAEPSLSGAKSATGIVPVVQALAQLAPSAHLFGSSAAEQAEVSRYIEQADVVVGMKFVDVAATADALDNHLALRTFLVGPTVSAADAALWSAFRLNLPALGVVKKNTYKHVTRWYKFLETLPAFAQALQAVQSAKSNKDRTKKAASSFDLFLGDLPPGSQVVTRFPPEPSGYLHIGHAKAAILNQYFAEKYNGKLLIRFDDTNPRKEKEEYENSIIEDLTLLGINADGVPISHTSDYFEQIEQYLHQLVFQGDAYADDTPLEQMRYERGEGIASKNRTMTPERTWEVYQDMKTGSDEGRKWCIRAKMSVDNPNKAMRDPVLYRCNVEYPHHRTGSKYKAYPTYDFANPIVDSIEGVTHSLRSNEYRDRNPQYYWFIEHLKLRNVRIWDYARLNFVYTLLSKRKLQWFVDNGYVSGWDDPRFPTVRGIRRRGMTVDCIRQFILATGPSQQVINMEWDGIWSLNKRIIDPVVPRFAAVEEKGIVKATIVGAGAGEQAYEKELPRHKKNSEIGTKLTVFGPHLILDQADAQALAEGEEFTLMDWGNAIVTKKHAAADGSVSSLELQAHLEGDFTKTDKKVTWLSTDTVAASRPLVPVLLQEFDYLITKKKLDEDDAFGDFLTPETEFDTPALAAADVATLQEGDRLQFERKGYYILDRVQGPDGRRVFIKIPDGKAAAVASKHAPAPTTSKAATKKDKAAAKTGAAQAASAQAQSSLRDSQGTHAAAASAKTVDCMYKLPTLTDNMDTDVQTNMYKLDPIV